MKNFRFALVVLVVLSAAAVIPAHAGLIINAGIDGTINSDPNSAAIVATINTAIGAYQSLFSNNITVKIYFQEMSTGLGQSTTGIYNIGYADFRAGLAAQYAISGNSNQGTALASLPTGTLNPVTATTGLNVSSADGRALGFNTPGV